MAKGDKSANAARPIIIKREEVVAGGHHGGAWKVAYADFVTAMMAFFLLMWLLNATTAKQRQGIADYFSPSNVMASNTSGFGAPFGGHTPNDDGSLASDRGAVEVMKQDTRPIFNAEDDDSDSPAQANTTGPADPNPNTRTSQPGKAEQPAVRPADQDTKTPPIRPGDEKQAFEKAAEQIRKAVANDPSLAELAKQLAVDLTPEGLRIQILDGDKQAMFPTGSADLSERAKMLLQKVVPILSKLSEPISITGHTDATPFKRGDRSNWELSTDRANATRRVFTESGIAEERIQTVSGRADRDPLLPADPMAAVNRRIAVVVLRTAPPSPAAH